MVLVLGTTRGSKNVYFSHKLFDYRISSFSFFEKCPMGLLLLEMNFGNDLPCFGSISAEKYFNINTYGDLSRFRFGFVFDSNFDYFKQSKEQL